MPPCSGPPRHLAPAAVPACSINNYMEWHCRSYLGMQHMPSSRLDSADCASSGFVWGRHFAGPTKFTERPRLHLGRSVKFVELVSGALPGGRASMATGRSRRDARQQWLVRASRGRTLNRAAITGCTKVWTPHDPSYAVGAAYLNFEPMALGECQTRVCERRGQMVCMWMAGQPSLPAPPSLRCACRPCCLALLGSQQ